jgi:hypothetical protein
MRPPDLVLGVTVGLIALLAVLAGPAVPAVDFTSTPEGDLGNGSVDVARTDLPTEGTLSPGAYDSQRYFLRLPPAIVEFDRVQERPLLVYRLEIPALHFQRSNVFFLTAADRGRFQASFTEASIDASDIEASEYRATVTLLVRANETDRTLATGNLTVTVDDE